MVLVNVQLLELEHGEVEAVQSEAREHEQTEEEQHRLAEATAGGREVVRCKDERGSPDRGDEYKQLEDHTDTTRSREVLLPGTRETSQRYRCSN